MAIPRLRLGKTGVQVPMIGYGTATLGKITVMDMPMINKSVGIRVSSDAPRAAVE